MWTDTLLLNWLLCRFKAYGWRETSGNEPTRNETNKKRIIMEQIKCRIILQHHSSTIKQKWYTNGRWQTSLLGSSWMLFTPCNFFRQIIDPFFLLVLCCRVHIHSDAEEANQLYTLSMMMLLNEMGLHSLQHWA